MPISEAIAPGLGDPLDVVGRAGQLEAVGVARAPSRCTDVDLLERRGDGRLGLERRPGRRPTRTARRRRPARSRGMSVVDRRLRLAQSRTRRSRSRGFCRASPTGRSLCPSIEGARSGQPLRVGEPPGAVGISRHLGAREGSAGEGDRDRGCRGTGAASRLLRTTKVIAVAGSAAPWSVPEGRALVTSLRVPATFREPSLEHDRFSGRLVRASTAFPRVCVGGNGPFGGSDDEDSVGQYVGVGVGGGSCLRCGRAGSADRRHHRHHHVQRRPVHARGDDHHRVAGASGHAVRSHRRQRHLRGSRAAAR